jgi:hypothetical protein
MSSFRTVASVVQLGFFTFGKIAQFVFPVRKVTPRSQTDTHRPKVLAQTGLKNSFGFGAGRHVAAHSSPLAACICDNPKLKSATVD